MEFKVSLALDLVIIEVIPEFNCIPSFDLAPLWNNEYEVYHPQNFKGTAMSKWWCVHNSLKAIIDRLIFQMARTIKDLFCNPRHTI